MQSISIRNLGPIKEFDYEIKDLTLLIGGQGSGKSTIAKAVFFFRSMVKDLISSHIDSLLQAPRAEFSWSRLRNDLFTRLLEYFGKEYLNSDYSLVFLYSEKISLHIQRKEEHRTFIDFSDECIAEIDSIVNTVKEKVQEYSGFSQDSTSRTGIILGLVTLKSVTLDSIFQTSKRQVYIPAARSKFATHKDRYEYLVGNQKDLISNNFIDEVENVRSWLNEYETGNNELLPEAGETIDLVKQILGGELRTINEVDRFFFASGKSLDISWISSGQQEALWLVNLLFAISAAKAKNFNVVIEEPEAHLHPKTQFLLCKLIALTMHLNGAQVFITTHSPYIIAAFNNMLLGAKVGAEKPIEAEEILSRKFWIDHNSVFAGEIHDGIVEDILSRDLAMIKIERIDTISRTINDEFDRLSDLEDVPLAEDFEFEQEG